jgi:hypothetical protein
MRPRSAQGKTPTNAWTEDPSNGGCRDPGHAFVQNLRRGHYELAIDAMPLLMLATAFDELRLAI